MYSFFDLIVIFLKEVSELFPDTPLPIAFLDLFVKKSGLENPLLLFQK